MKASLRAECSMMKSKEIGLLENSIIKNFTKAEYYWTNSLWAMSKYNSGKQCFSRQKLMAKIQTRKEK